jgi:glycosyltransferase involved in cell wall biosynthesis
LTAPGRPLRVCLVYDCLYPHTVGGAEKWYRNVGRRLAADGHDVTYLTLRQWRNGTDASYDGVKVVAVGPQMALYTRTGRRRILPPLVFGLGVLGHLVRRGGTYNVVHSCSFPYFSVLAIAAVRRFHRFRVVIDWHEVWTDDYWRGYLGRRAGRIGALVQRACARVPQLAFCFSRLHANRLRALGLRGPVQVLTGELERPPDEAPRVDGGSGPPTVVFAGRHIPEKRVPALVAAFARARREMPQLVLEILGDGPDRSEVLRRIDDLGLREVTRTPGFVGIHEVDQALRDAACLVLPSEREGYGLVVVEASARGTPSVVVKGHDNAAVELVEDGVNGVIAGSVEPEELGSAILRVVRAGTRLRESTAAWYARNARRLSLDDSLDRVAAAYVDAGTRESSSSARR